MIQYISAVKLSGKISIPPSKSDAQRALLSAALATGVSNITGIGKSNDELAMLAAIQKLGSKVTVSSNEIISIQGISKLDGPKSLSAGESGLGIRLLTAVSATFSEEITLTGTGSLSVRPMAFYGDVLPLLEVEFHSKEGLLPLRVKGPMVGKSITVDGSLSSQFISGLLMAMPLAKGDSVLTVSNLTSGPYVEMTLQTLLHFGIEIKHSDLNQFQIKGNQIYKASDYRIDADWSSASYWLVAAALGNEIICSGLKMDSFQADKALINQLEIAGCTISITNDGIKVDGSQRKAFAVDASECPDLFPALVVLAASIKGTSKISGASRLVHKESHRGLALQSEFGKLGVHIELNSDEMIIFGTGKLNGGKVHSHHDHRIAMCLAIAGTFSDGEIEIEDAEAVSKSYPGFWEDFNRLMRD